MNSQELEKNPLFHPKYRPDIDGLRAVAVLAVILFHAFPNVIRGGFIGVDIFFIISGFLISSILLKSLNDGSFSFQEFYRRRILRIFPALILVSTVCYGIGWMVLLPAEFKQLGKHMVGGALFVANLVFWDESGYFDNISESKPLLHLWSLGVEEQYYIIWPCLLLLAWKWQWKILWLIGTVMVLSFAVNVYTVYLDPVHSFYSPVARFWELLFGSLLAYFQLYKVRKGESSKPAVSGFKQPRVIFRILDVNSPPIRNGLSVLGAVLIVLGVAFIDRDALFPGWWVLLPTFGAYLIVLAGPQAIVNRTLLSTRVMVGLGLISYPLYLWHWPLLSFARIIENTTPAPAIRVTALILAVLLAWLTYLWVERPIRFGNRSRGQLFGLVLAMILLIPLGGSAFLLGNVRSSTMTDVMREQIAKLDFGLHFAKWSSCPDESGSWNCKVLNPNKPIEIALIGDSHSVHLASGLAELDTIVERNIMSRNSDGCMPVISVEVDGEQYYDCNGQIEKALDEAIRLDSIRAIMLSGYAVWKIRPLDHELSLKEITDEEAQISADILDKALTLTLSRLVASGKKIVFFVDNPVLDFEPTECVLIRPFYFSGHVPKHPCAIARQRFDRRNVEYHQIIRKAERAFPSVQFIRIYDYLCDQELCNAQSDGVLLYRDHSHLSADGSRYVLGKIANRIRF